MIRVTKMSPPNSGFFCGLLNCPGGVNPREVGAEIGGGMKIVQWVNAVGGLTRARLDQFRRQLVSAQMFLYRMSTKRFIAQSRYTDADCLAAPLGVDA